jgi:Rhodopirellula transposase DDE domain
MIEFSAMHQVDVQLAYYPPYHSKYNPIERVFGVLENYWNGDPLTSKEKAVSMAQGMTYKGIHAKASLLEGEYPKGVKLDKKAMKPYEKCLRRMDKLGKWFITISASAATALIASMAI